MPNAVLADSHTPARMTRTYRLHRDAAGSLEIDINPDVDQCVTTGSDTARAGTKNTDSDDLRMGVRRPHLNTNDADATHGGAAGSRDEGDDGTAMYLRRWFSCAITTGTPHRRPVRARTGAESYVWLLASALPDRRRRRRA
jgi:hypothetical protein